MRISGLVLAAAMLLPAAAAFAQGADAPAFKDMPLPAPLTATPEQVARAIVNAVHKKKNVLYVKWFWRWIMLIIRNVPEPIFKKLKL